MTNACRYCAKRLDDERDALGGFVTQFCSDRCKAAARGNRPAVAATVAGHNAETPSLLDREPIVNDPDQMEMFNP